ncbi:hypothetical protein [Streptomyces bobili]|uniref:hypothetical protein n=1 Tax=Streptomyces bobili TaxID=67280 RepID=UPI00378946EE
MTADERRTLSVVVPDATQTGESVEVRALVGGRDILADAFDKGPGEDPRYLLVPGGPLTAGSEPHELRLAKASCTEGCCGALYVTIQRDGEDVLWNGWRNPDEDEVDLPAFRFPAHEYQREIERVTADLSGNGRRGPSHGCWNRTSDSAPTGSHVGNANSARFGPGPGSRTRSTSSSSIRAALPSARTAHGCSSR